MKQRETAIFKKTVAAVQQHDEATSKAYSNELAEVKKMTKIVTQSKIALEQITDAPADRDRVRRLHGGPRAGNRERSRTSARRSPPRSPTLKEHSETSAQSSAR